MTIYNLYVPAEVCILALVRGVGTAEQVGGLEKKFSLANDFVSRSDNRMRMFGQFK